MIYPSLSEFRRLAKSHTIIPVYIECLADELTPMSLFHARYEKSRACFLLESVEGGEHLGRYSFAAFDPAQVLRSRGETLSLESGHRSRQWVSKNPLEDVRRLLKDHKAAEVKGLPRFFGGAVGFVSYDMVRFFEKLPSFGRDDLGLPDSFFFFTRDMFVFDHVAHTVKVVRCVPVEKGQDPAAAYRQAEKALRKIVRDIHQPTFAPTLFPVPQVRKAPVQSGGKREYMEAVRRTKGYIAAGDIIQAVLSRRVSLKTKAHPLNIYRSLRCINPSPYMYFLRDGETHIIGSSPEMLVRLEGRRAETRPIAGTRRRGSDEAADMALAEDLLKDEKERAEHLMLVDLGRNDLGRVCRPGTVQVPEFMKIERYSHVMHMVSSVLGELNGPHDAFDLFQACFPAGTVSGAPKIRAMEIIEELEKARRGPYAGAVGYFSYSGNMDMAITIRTIVLEGRRAFIQSGAGIVADSVPEREFLEVQSKAAAMLSAIRLAEEKN
ncbi:MAG: anthranilate synthase component I [Elusimicrobia bacterium]|nr:anthranilate synthase component I [Elusimicrobiota bacterium]